MESVFAGKTVWQFGDNYNADLIVGSQYIASGDKKLLGAVCLADYDPELAKRLVPGDLMIAGRNFGYGHPHQQGIWSLQAKGVATVIAESFYPLWYRVAVFWAFPAVVCPGISTQAKVGDELRVDVLTGRVENLTTGVKLQGEPIAPPLLEIMRDGGLPAHLKKVAREKAAQAAA